jgi:hypothetical protein
VPGKLVQFGRPVFKGGVQQPDGLIQRGRAEMHVPLRRPEILMGLSHWPLINDTPL